jgi:hypothetical protein
MCRYEKNLIVHAGWEAPSSSAKPQPPISEALRPLLHECYAMYSLLLPYALPIHCAASTTQQVERPLAASHKNGRLLDSAASPAGYSSVVSSLAEKNANVLVGIRESSRGHLRLAWKPAANVSLLATGCLLGGSVQQDVLICNGKPMRSTVCKCNLRNINAQESFLAVVLLLDVCYFWSIKAFCTSFITSRITTTNNHFVYWTTSNSSNKVVSLQVFTISAHKNT